MNLHFLGTGAADWDINHPNGSKEFRRFSSMLLDEKLLLDCGPCLHEFEATFGYNALFKQVKNILLTHSHGDHFSAETLKKLAAMGTIDLYGDKAVEKLIKDIPGLYFHPIALFEPIEVDGYRVTALPANHSVLNAGEQPRHYIVQTDDKTLFYGLDGAWLKKETVVELKKHRFDCMIFDATIGDTKGDYRIFEHNNLRMVEEMKMTIEASELIKPNGKFIITHMARTLHTDHDTLQKRVLGSGIVAAYDNLRISI